jgi:hypothetical protein
MMARSCEAARDERAPTTRRLLSVSRSRLVRSAFAAALIAALASAQPLEWLDATLEGSLLYVNNDDGSQVSPAHLPAIGNGYVATQIGARGAFVAGVFSGPAVASTPSHRAAMPSGAAFSLPGCTVVHAG